MPDNPLHTTPAVSAPLDFSGRVVLVTGGTRGVGRGIADRFSACGATVVTCGRNAPDEQAGTDRPDFTAADFPAADFPAADFPAADFPAADFPAADFIAADVRDQAQVQALVAEIVARHGRLDVLVNNAGGSPPADTATASQKFTTRIIELNLIAPLLCAQAAFAVMAHQDTGGTIVNIASVSGVRPSPTTAAYGAAKAGLLNLTETLAVEFAPRVRVNAITVGYVVTEQAHLFYGDEAGIARVGASVALERMAAPTDIGDACLFFASPLASYVSGANLCVHGGGEKPAYIDAARGAGG